MDVVSSLVGCLVLVVLRFQFGNLEAFTGLDSAFDLLISSLQGVRVTSLMASLFD